MVTFTEEYLSEIIIALIGFLGILVSQVVTYKISKGKAEQLQKQKLECDFKAMTLGFNQFLSQWNRFLPELQELMAETSITRFIILCAWNGKDEPKYTTALYQYHQDAGVTRQYINFELDTHYQQILREVQYKGEARMVTAELPPCTLRSVYLDEEVTESLMIWLSYEKLKGSESAAITYCSFASQDGEPINERTHIGCIRVANMLKGLANHHINM